MKKLLYILIIIAGLFLLQFALVQGATTLFPYQGGTGIGTVGVGDVGKCLIVSDDVPFTYTVGECGTGGGGSGGGGFPLYVQNDGATLNTATTTLNFTANSFSLVEDPTDTFAIRVATSTLGLLASAISDFVSTVRTSISETITGLTYTSGTGVLSLDSGYTIPTTTREVNQDTAFGWGNHASAGYLTTVDISANTNLAVTHPILLTGDTLSLAFSTTTANAWSSLQSFTYASTTGISGTNLNFTSATTTSLSVSGVFHFFTQAWASLAEFVTYIQTLYTGGSHVTITAGSIAVDDDFLLNNGDTGTGTYDFSGATLKQHVYPSFTFPATPTTTTATTTISLGTAFVAETWNSADCWVSSGTVALSFSDGTNLMTPRTASTTVLRWSLATNNTFTASEKRFVNIGALTNATISCTVDKTVN